jgi:hypothetical protein
MDLSQRKREVLEALLLHDKPVKAVEIAKEMAKEQRAVQMHLTGLVLMGYASSPQKGYCIISENGKKALGLPEVSKEIAVAILAPKPFQKAFHFYSDVGKPLNITAKDLLEFCDKMGKVTVESVNFHFSRGDFEAWFNYIGDAELSKKMELLKKEKISAAEVPGRIREIVENRCMVLAETAGQKGLS